MGFGAAGRPDLVFHLAANTHTWEHNHECNDAGTENLLRAFGPLGARNHIVFTSTTAVLDNREDLGEPLGPSEREPLHGPRRASVSILVNHYRFLVPPCLNVLEMGCGVGNLLAAVRPARGVGVDFSPRTVAIARQRHPELKFQVGEASEWSCVERFDYILLSDLINDLPDVQAVFEHLRDLAHPHSRLVLNFLNTLWRPGLALAEKIALKAPSLLQNWLSTGDVANLLHLAGWEVVKVEHRILWPLRTPLLAGFLNKWLAPLLPHFCLTVFIVARPRPEPASRPHYSCSVVVPARNEAGNIEAAVKRTPQMGLGTEIVFVEGNSTDDTWKEIQRVTRAFPQRNIKAIRQTGRGKGNAAREGFAAATGDLLFILDADLTMPPEELPKYYEVARSGKADLVNGVRLVYPMEHEAMRFLNIIANKLFGLAFSWLLGQRIKDTLCGTKVLFRCDYAAIANNRGYFGDFDPFGDFDLLFGATKLNLRLIDLPIRYRARTYGETNIRRWKHGWLLLRMVCFAAKKLKFPSGREPSGGYATSPPVNRTPVLARRNLAHECQEHGIAEDTCPTRATLLR